MHKSGGQGYNGVKNDIFSLGVVLFTISFKSGLWSRPSEPSEKNIIFRRLRDRGIDFMLDSHPASKPIFSEGKIGNLANLLGLLLSIDPAQRPDSVNEILAHPFLNDDAASDTDTEMTEVS